MSQPEQDATSPTDAASSTRPPTDDADGTATSAPSDPTPSKPPLTRFAERFRIPLGALVALVGIGLAVGFALGGPNDVELGANRATVAHIAGVAIWVFVAGVGITWALRLPRWSTNTCAALAIASYAVVWVISI